MKLPDSADQRGAAIAFVVLVTLAVYSPSLGCYYFSEDIIQNWIAYQALTAHPELLTQHLTMPWFQCSNMGLFCRPLVEYSFIADRILFGWSQFAAAGAHLTNLLCHMVSTALCLLIGHHLIRKHLQSTQKFATIYATTGALIFALYPLQAETVYWLCCRCDCLATMLSLATIYLALLASDKNNSWRKSFITLSALSYFLAVESKENAAMAPLVIALYAFMYPSSTATKAATNTDEKAEKNSGEKFTPFLAVLKSLLPYMVVLAICAMIRFAVLGGIGGYHGTFGAVFDDHPWQRILDPIAWNKLFYPLDEQQFFKTPNYPFLFSATYLFMALGAVLGIKAGTFNKPITKLILFCTLAGILLVAGSLKVFLIMDSLVGGHFVYLSQAFWGPALALFFSTLKPNFLKQTLTVSYLLLITYTTTVNAGAWAQRGHHMRALQESAVQWASENTARGRKFCLLNMPLDAREFSSVYDLEQLRCLLKPPLAKTDMSAVVVEHSFMRMAADAGCKTRIFNFIRTGNVDFVLSSVATGKAWQLLQPAAMKQLLEPIDSIVQTKACAGGHGKWIDLDISTIDCPQRADIVALRLRRKKSTSSTPSGKPAGSAVFYGQPLMFCPTGNTVTLTWHTDLTIIDPAINWSTAPLASGPGPDPRPNPIINDDETVCIFPLADRISWKYSGKVHNLLLTNLPDDFQVVSARLLNETAYTPGLTAASQRKATSTPIDSSNLDPLADGFYPVNDNQLVACTYDSSAVEGAAGTMVQISERDFVYSNYADGYRESTTVQSSKHTSKTLLMSTQNGCLRGCLDLTRSDFPGTGKYQVRVAACDSNNKTIGFCSDPIDVMVTDTPFKSSYDKAIFNLRAQKQGAQGQ